MLRKEAVAGRKALTENGVKLILLKGIHNKSLAIDDSVLVEGSFNWLLHVEMGVIPVMNVP